MELGALGPNAWIAIGVGVLIIGRVLYVSMDSAVRVVALFLGVGLIMYGTFDPKNIKSVGVGKDGIEIESRYQTTGKERELVLKLAQDKPSPEIEKKGEKFIEEAEERTSEQRSPEDYLALATQKWRAKDYDAALADVYAGLALNPENIRIKATLIHRKGSIYENLGLLDKGIKYYQEAMDLDPKFSWPHNNLGALYHNQRRFREAEEEYKKAIELNRKYAHPHNGLGTLYYNQGRLEEAEEEYKKAIELDSKDAFPHIRLGNVYEKQKKLKEAEEEYKKVIELDPKEAFPHLRLGYVYEKQKKLKEAEEEYKKVIELDPQLAGPHINLGNVYREQGKLEAAKSEYEEALRLWPNLTVAKEYLEDLNRKMKEGK